MDILREDNALNGVASWLEKYSLWVEFFCSYSTHLTLYSTILSLRIFMFKYRLKPWFLLEHRILAEMRYLIA